MVLISPRRWLYLPIETRVREIDGKTLLALEAAERGWGVVVGKKDIETDPDFPAGMNIAKSIAPGQTSKFAEMRGKGRKISAWCEEGLVYPNAELYGQRNLERDAFDQLTFYFAWGRRLAEDLSGKLGCSREKITVSGNPRFDLLRPDLRGVFATRVSQIRATYGPLILVNTAFTLANNFMGSETMIADMRQHGRIRTSTDEARLRDLADFQRKIRDGFVPMVQALSRNLRSHCIILRPHPSEDHDYWRRAFAGLDNVVVIGVGNVAEWILAAEATIHNNCTTGIEAFLLGKTPIAYQPATDEEHDLFLPHAVSDLAVDLDELLALVRARLDRSSIVSTHRRRARVVSGYVANASGPPATTTIMDVLDTADVPEVGLQAPANGHRRVRTTVRRGLQPLKEVVSGAQRRRWQQYRQQKFGLVSRAEMAAFIANVTERTDRFRNVKILELGDNTFCFYT